YDRLVALVEQTTLAENQRLVGREVEVLVAVGEGRKDSATGRLSGRARDGRLVHFRADPATVRPGDIVRTVITHAAPHHLIADQPLLAHRRTRAGDAYQAGQAPRTAGVMLGMPTRSQPAVPTSGNAG